MNSKYEQFLLEKELGKKLFNSSLDERRSAYKSLYGEFFNKFPGVSYNPQSNLHHKLQWQMKFLKPFLNKNKTFLEVGAGNCLLSIEVAKHVKQVIAYEVADTIPHIDNKPDNLCLKIFNGVDFFDTIRDVDLIYSNQVFEHLHTDDALNHIKNYYNMLKKKGQIVIITPHSITGPHDISRDFCTTPQGLHMKEYTYRELRTILSTAGFKSPKGYIGHKKLGYYAINIFALILAESFYKLFPRTLRYKLRNNLVLLNLFGIKITAIK